MASANVPAPLHYRTGEEIKKGDRVRFHGNQAEVEFVAWGASDSDRELAWYKEEYGGGVMISEPLAFGRAFIPSDQLAECEDLEFLERSPSSD